VAHRWHPEEVVDEELARELIAAQFPSLPLRSVELVAAGWDYTVHRVDEEWAFRFPRREIVIEPMGRELDALRVLAPLLPVAVPAPVYVGRPTETFPWPFYGARWLPGADAGTVELSAGDRAALARPLAAFLRRLHASDVIEMLPELPVDPMGRGEPAVRVPRTRDELAAVAVEGLWEPPREALELLRDAERLPPAAPVAVCHGDLHFRQLLFDEAALTGVVDWVDVCRGDPGIDLMLVYAFLPPEARPRFFAEYGPVAEESLLRARVLAFNLSSVLARYGRAQGLPAVEREAVASLDRAAYV
jgi:aminoglycoside phosphotransferase (APT) family kinase protein